MDGADKKSRITWLEGDAPITQTLPVEVSDGRRRARYFADSPL